MKSIWIILGTLVLVVGGLFAAFKLGLGKKKTGTPAEPASAAVAPTPGPAPAAGNRDAQNIAAATGLVTALAGGLKGLGVQF